MDTSDNAISTDKIGSKLFYEYMVHMAKDHGLSGVTVYHSIMGFGKAVLSEIRKEKMTTLKFLY